jgi:hypothetical protein
MALFDYISTRGVADKLILRYGMKASLRRGGVDRACYVVVTDYMPKDASTSLASPTDRRVYIAAGLGAVPTTPPDWEVDQLVTYVQPLGTVVNEILPFTMPVKPISPAGVVVCYETTVRR